VLVKNSNRPPSASVPAVVEATEGQTVRVLGTGSDPDGDVLTYEWTQVDGPTVALSGADTERVSFFSPAVESDTVVALQLVVRDVEFASAPARVDVVVRNQARTGVESDSKRTGCGCTTGLDAGAAGLLSVVALLRARRRT
jgi:MYXO-CTERM domain-containing protein